MPKSKPPASGWPSLRHESHPQQRGSKPKWPFADAVRQLSSVRGTFAFLEFVWQHFFCTGLTDRGHGLDLELLWDAQLYARPLIVKALHTVDDKSLAETLEREVFPRCSGIKGVRNRRLAIIL